MHVARTAADLERMLAASRAGFRVERVPAAAAEDWSLVDGALQHRSRGFFSVCGLRRGAEEFVLLHQPQGAVTGLVAARIDGEYCVLLQARAEPGCLGEAQFGPTVQSTPANYLRLHGGRPTPFVESFISFSPGTTLVDQTTQLDLGSRYVFKSKQSLLVETREPREPAPPYVWASNAAIREAVRRSACLNIDLRSLLAIAGWGDDDRTGLGPAEERVLRSARAPIRPEAVGGLAARLTAATGGSPAFVPLPSLDHWVSDADGWRERAPRQGFEINYYAVTAGFREKAAWVQPLVNSLGEGEVVLACRERDGFLEVHVRAAEEVGLATSVALQPSYLRYPGEDRPPPDWLRDAVPVSETTESDEGGRFFRDVSRYRVVAVAAAGPADGAWLRLSELKLFLRMSNVCTIQLRGVASQLLGLDEPG